MFWWQKSADQGFAAAQFRLGRAYYWGDVVAQDQKVAQAWIKRAADQGYVAAIVWLQNAQH